MDINLGRVFEQLEMLRAESRQMIEAQAEAAARVPPVAAPARTILTDVPLTEVPPVERPAQDALAAPPAMNAYANAATMASHGLTPEAIAARCGLPAGEARLLASLAAARVSRDQAGPPAGQAQVDASIAADTARSATSVRKG